MLFSQTCKLDRLSIGCTCIIDDVYNFINKMSHDEIKCLSFIHRGYVMLSPQTGDIQIKKKVQTLEIHTWLPWKCIKVFFELFTVAKVVIGYPPFHSYPVQDDDLIIDVGNAHVVSMN